MPPAIRCAGTRPRRPRARAIGRAPAWGRMSSCMRMAGAHARARRVEVVAHERVLRVVDAAGVGQGRWPTSTRSGYSLRRSRSASGALGADRVIEQAHLGAMEARLVLVVATGRVLTRAVPAGLRRCRTSAGASGPATRAARRGQVAHALGLEQPCVDLGAHGAQAAACRSRRGADALGQIALELLLPSSR